MTHFSLATRKISLRLLLCLAGLLALLLLASHALAAVNALSLPWWTADSGGKSTGANYILYSAIGQPDAGSMAGGVYKLTGGFLAGPAGPSTAYKLYLPAAFNP